MLYPDTGSGDTGEPWKEIRISSLHGSNSAISSDMKQQHISKNSTPDRKGLSRVKQKAWLPITQD